jgi:hypothetical protein
MGKIKIAAGMINPPTETSFTAIILEMIKVVTNIAEIKGSQRWRALSLLISSIGQHILLRSRHFLY